MRVPRTAWQRRRRPRAQASVIGVVLVIAITVAGVTGIMLFGASSLEEARAQSEIDAAEHAMTQLDSTFSLVALGSAEYQSSPIVLRSGASLAVDEDRGWMNVTVVNRTSNEVNYTVFNTSMGAIVYEKDDTTVAYQGGGVWKKNGDGSVMISPPEFHYRTSGGKEPTLTLPLVVVRGSGSIAERATVSRYDTVAKYPVTGNADRTNPLEGGKINVTVKSEYYRGWGEFFEDRTGGTVSYDHDRGQVTITLVVRKGAQQVQGGIVSGSAAYTLAFGQQAVIDSYNSTEGPYDGTGENSSIIAAGDVEMGQGATIKGDLVTGKSLVLAGGSGQQITGDLTYGGSPPSDPSVVDGEIRSGADVSVPPSVGWLISERGAELSPPDNDNGIDNDIGPSNTITCAGDCRLEKGEYYLDSFDLNGDELTLDTSSGDVELYVHGDFTVDKDAEKIRVVGPNTARIFLNKDFTFEKGEVRIPDNRSAALWVYMRPGTKAHFHKAHFEGVLYGPGSGAQSGVKIGVQSDNDIYGGLVGRIPASGSDGIGQNDQIHFDEVLANEDPLGPHGGTEPTVTYMHVTVNRVNVTSR